MDSILNHILSTVQDIFYLIIKKKKEKKVDLPTYLPIQKLMGRSTANKENILWVASVA